MILFATIVHGSKRYVIDPENVRPVRKIAVDGEAKHLIKALDFALFIQSLLGGACRLALRGR